jgi:hypothetical protein
LADTPNQAAQMRPHLDAVRHPAGPQKHRDRTAALGVVDVDRQKAVFVVIRVEEMTAVRHVDRIAISSVTALGARS